MYEAYQDHSIAVYGGYLKERRKLLESSSGGIATALAEHIIGEGGYVAGVAYDASFRKAEYIVVDNVNDLSRLKGSKYIETDKCNVFTKVRDILNQGKRVLFFGLPCIVAALYGTLRGTSTDNLITCELICHGHTSQKVHQEYIDHLEKKHRSKIVRFSVRYKKNGWTPSYVHAEFSNGKTFEKPFYDTEYGHAFSVYSNLPCYSCRFKGNDRQGDIMLGDFWGAKKEDPFWNDNGVSVVLVHSKKGLDFINSTDGIALFETSLERAISGNPNIIRQRKLPDSRERFDRLFQEKGLLYAAKHTKSRKKRIVKLAKRAIPKSLISLANSAYKKIKSLIKTTRN